MIATHSLTNAQFAAVAGGAGGPDVIDALWRGQRSRRRLWLALLIREWPVPDVE